MIASGRGVRVRREVIAVAMAVTLGFVGLACSSDAPRSDTDGPDRHSLEPRFPRDPAAGGQIPPQSRSTTTRGAGSGPGSAVGATTGSTASTGGGGAGGERSSPGLQSGTTSAQIDDRSNDVTPSPLDPAPDWADLVGAKLARNVDSFELRVKLRGASAPPSAPDDDHTMNIASFYDVDGNGSIDYEVWLNIASGGWGSSYFDNTGARKGGFQEKSGVAISVEGTEVVARFPLDHLARADRFRWSLASEWGRYEFIGTTAAARDDMPDNNAAAYFPGR